MKNLRFTARVLTVLGAFAALLFFFFPFVSYTFANGDTIMATGAQISFGGSLKLPETGEIYKSATSLYFTLTILIALLAVILAGAAFKYKGASVAAPAFSFLSLAMFLTFLSQDPRQHVDCRPFSAVDFEPHLDTVAFAQFFYISLFVMIFAVVMGVVTIFVNDAVEVREKNGERKFMLVRFGRWLLDYKSELKKIVWPTKEETIRNTLIVVAMCVVVGAIVWILDFGLVALLKLFTDIKS